MKKTLKGFYLVVSSLFITLLHLPFAFAKISTVRRPDPKAAVATASRNDSTMFTRSFRSVYDSLHLNLSGLSRQAFDYAQKGWEKLVQQGRIVNNSVVTIVDFSQPSTQKRMYVLDMENYKVLFNTLVAHGRNSGKEMASVFSNRPSSLMSSPGFYITRETYYGDNGYSLRLEGVEPGINDKASERAIVMHGAPYVDESFIARQGYIGRSWGCPAVPLAQAQPIINTVKEGTCLFIYTPDNRYISHSRLLRG